MKRKVPVSLIIGWLLAVSLASASAAPATYIVSGVGSGRLGASTFSNASFTITSTANTSQILPMLGEVIRVDDLTTTLSIAGLGSAAFDEPLITIDNQNLGRAGYRDGTGDGPLLAVQNSIFDTYTLSTSIGPINGMPVFGMGDTPGDETTSGLFTLTSVSSAAFQAIVPDRASTLGLLGLGLLALGIAHRWLAKPDRTMAVRPARNTAKTIQNRQRDAQFP